MIRVDASGEAMPRSKTSLATSPMPAKRRKPHQRQCLKEPRLRSERRFSSVLRRLAQNRPGRDVRRIRRDFDKIIENCPWKSDAPSSRALTGRFQLHNSIALAVFNPEAHCPISSDSATSDGASLPQPRFAATTTSRHAIRTPTVPATGAPPVHRPWQGSQEPSSSGGDPCPPSHGTSAIGRVSRRMAFPRIGILAAPPRRSVQGKMPFRIVVDTVLLPPNVVI